MAVDRRALRRFPGRKRTGRRRRAQIPAPNVVKHLGLALSCRDPVDPSTSLKTQIPMPGATEHFRLAVSCQDLVDADTLREAFQYDQEELSQAFLVDRRARVQAVQAIFVLMGVDHFDPIKKIVWSYLDQPPVWQFLADAGWSDCDVGTQSVLDDAERNGRDTVDVQFRKWLYRYFLTTMVQVNLFTGKSRALRRSSPWSTGLLLPRWQYETRFGWSDCDLDMQCSLADALREAECKKRAVVQRSMRGADYEFDFVGMKQTNIETGRVRALRFATPLTDGTPTTVTGSMAMGLDELTSVTLNSIESTARELNRLTSGFE